MSSHIRDPSGLKAMARRAKREKAAKAPPPWRPHEEDPYTYRAEMGWSRDG